jgi:hypothetical protein
MITRHARKYHSLLGKPIDFIPTNICIQSYLEMVQYLPIELGMGWNTTMIVAGVLARISLLPIRWF